MPCAACGRRKLAAVNFGGHVPGRYVPPVTTINQPQTTTWGPAMWFMLHSLGERVGRNSISSLQLDEVREFDMIIRSFPTTLPCPTCQQHAHIYLRSNPINWNKLRGPEITPVLRKWLFDFHNHVNANKSPASPEFNYEDVEPKYKPVGSIGAAFTTFFDELQLAINHRWVMHEAAQSIKRHMSILRGLTGL
jgi:hypothetical protein